MKPGEIKIPVDIDTSAAEEALATLETNLEAVHLPSTGLYVNFDVNDYLDTHSNAELFDLVGKLKDLLDG